MSRFVTIIEPALLVVMGIVIAILVLALYMPLFELSNTALSFVLVIGAITALFMGFLGIIQNDIKRVVAYSTLSQLGYMTVALAWVQAWGFSLFTQGIQGVVANPGFAFSDASYLAGLLAGLVLLVGLPAVAAIVLAFTEYTAIQPA